MLRPASNAFICIALAFASSAFAGSAVQQPQPHKQAYTAAVSDLRLSAPQKAPQPDAATKFTRIKEYRYKESDFLVIPMEHATAAECPHSCALMVESIHKKGTLFKTKLMNASDQKWVLTIYRAD